MYFSGSHCNPHGFPPSQWSDLFFFRGEKIFTPSTNKTLFLTPHLACVQSRYKMSKCLLDNNLHRFTPGWRAK